MVAGMRPIALCVPDPERSARMPGQAVGWRKSVKEVAPAGAKAGAVE